MLYHGCVARTPRYRTLAEIDESELASFQRGLRRRYTDEQIVEELQACAERLGRSPTMKEFAADPQTSVHPQTVIEHFGTWNAAKREAGLVPRRFATREELLTVLRELGERLGRSPTMREFGDDPETTVHPQTVIEHFGTWNKAKRAAGMVPRRFATREELLGLLQELGKRVGRVPTAKDLDANRGWMPSKSLYWHTFGSLTEALKEAGFDVPVGEERLERAIEQGTAMARRLGRLPKFNDWAAERKRDESLMTEWQVYRMFDARRGAWSTFQFLVRQRLLEDGVEVERDGSLGGG